MPAKRASRGCFLGRSVRSLCERTGRARPQRAAARVVRFRWGDEEESSTRLIGALPPFDLSRRAVFPKHGFRPPLGGTVLLGFGFEIGAEMASAGDQCAAESAALAVVAR